MSYKHGALGEIVSASEKSAAQTSAAPLYVGTAPVHTLAAGDDNLNKPVLVKSLNEAISQFGYSEDWAKFTLCEAMAAHFTNKGIGPIVLVNVLDVADNKSATATTVNKTPANGRVVIENAESIILDSISIPEKVLGTAYTTAYDYSTKRITIAEKTSGALGTASLAISYYTVDATGVVAADVIGTTDGAGINTGLHCVKDVYQLCGVIPDVILAPGFSDVKTVHDAMVALSQKVNGHWDTLVYTDIPLVSDATAVTMASAATWKSTNGYTADNEKTHFPMWSGSDGRNYHLSVLDAANRQALNAANDNVPYETASNTEIPVGGKLYFGASSTAIPDDQIINEKLLKNGISSAAYIGGRWVLWGAHTASYTQDTATAQNISETNLAMLQYISNNFQIRRAADIDQPVSKNRMQQIKAEEAARLDALMAAGALIYGEVTLMTGTEALADMQNGDFTFAFRVTTTPLSKSLTALVSYTADGLVTYFEEVA